MRGKTMNLTYPNNLNAQIDYIYIYIQEVDK